MQRQRVIDRNSHQVTEFSSLESFLSVSTLSPGVQTIYHGEVPIDLLISPTQAATTIFFFHGAIEPHFKLPVLSGLGISGGVEANRVFISDPSLVLDKKLMLSWYAGNKLQPYLQRDLRMIMEKVAVSLGTERSIFFGGSGGGFAALYYASYFPRSLALVFNPQTNIARYVQSAVRDYAHRAFDVDPRDNNPLDQLPPSVIYDLCAHYSTPQSNSVAYIQNLQDETHIRNHLTPFLEAIHPDTRLRVLADQWREGHTPPPKTLLTSLLSNLATSTSWESSLLDSGFRAAWDKTPSTRKEMT